MLAHYLLIAARNLGRHRVNALVSVIGVALGLACFVGARLFASFVDGADRHFPLNAQSRHQSEEHSPRRGRSQHRLPHRGFRCNEAQVGVRSQSVVTARRAGLEVWMRLARRAFSSASTTRQATSSTSSSGPTRAASRRTPSATKSRYPPAGTAA